jgi:hypothetical protein
VVWNFQKFVLSSLLFSLFSFLSKTFFPQDQQLLSTFRIPVFFVSFSFSLSFVDCILQKEKQKNTTKKMLTMCSVGVRVGSQLDSGQDYV